MTMDPDRFQMRDLKRRVKRLEDRYGYLSERVTTLKRRLKEVTDKRIFLDHSPPFCECDYCKNLGKPLQ